jgi:hypothetical protein
MGRDFEEVGDRKWGRWSKVGDLQRILRGSRKVGDLQRILK